MNRLRQKKGFIKTSAIFVALVMLWLPSQAQVVKTMTLSGEPGELFMLPEVGAIIIKSDDGPKVEMVLPSDQRPENYKTADIQAGDIIKMFNGKSMKTVLLIEETYNALGIGDELKFGVRRDKDIFIVKFGKMDPKDAPGQMMIKTCPASGAGEIGDIISNLVEIGLVLNEKEGQIFVADVITEMPTVFTGAQPETGDQLIKIQSHKITSTKELAQIYGKIKAGEKTDLTMLRGGKEIVLQFVKPKSGPGAKPVKIIRKQGQ